MQIYSCKLASCQGCYEADVVVQRVVYMCYSECKMLGTASPRSVVPGCVSLLSTAA
jgi:hypothetical protein